MSQLKGKTFFIGKEPGQGRLLVALKINNQWKATTIGAMGSVPNCVSRCIPAEEKAHCSIAIDSKGTMIITNLKPQNVTYVDGVEYNSKRITNISSISLGRDKYPLNLAAVWDAVDKLLAALPPAPRSIKHLEQVWEEFETANETITLRQQQKANRRMLPMLIGSASGLIAPIMAIVSSTATLWVTAPISIISFLIYFKNYTEKDTSVEDRKIALNKFIDNYVCPHERCNHHYLGNQPYKVLRQNKKCPYCGGEWTED